MVTFATQRILLQLLMFCRKYLFMEELYTTTLDKSLKDPNIPKPPNFCRQHTINENVNDFVQSTLAYARLKCKLLEEKDMHERQLKVTHIFLLFQKNIWYF